MRSARKKEGKRESRGPGRGFSRSPLPVSHDIGTHTWITKEAFSPAVARASADPDAVAFAPLGGPANTSTSKGLPDTGNPSTWTVLSRRKKSGGKQKTRTEVRVCLEGFTLLTVVDTHPHREMARNAPKTLCTVLPGTKVLTNSCRPPTAEYVWKLSYKSHIAF